MGLKALLDSVSELSEELKPHYVEIEILEDGKKVKKFQLDVSDIDSHPKVRGLVTANKENKTKRDTHKAKVDELEATLAAFPDDLTPETFAEIKAKADAADADGKKPDEQLQQQKAMMEQQITNLKAAHAEELGKKDVEIGERDTWIDRSVKEGGLKQALLEVHVKPELLPGALALLSPSAKVKRGDDGDRTAMFETDLGETPLPEFVKNWAEGDVGKHYVQKPTGPDAKGGPSGHGGDKTIKRVDFNKLGMTDQRARVSDGFAVVD